MNARPPTWPVEPPLAPHTLDAWRKLARSHDRALTQTAAVSKAALGEILWFAYDAAGVIADEGLLEVIGDDVAQRPRARPGHLVALREEPKKPPETPMRP